MKHIFEYLFSKKSDLDKIKIDQRLVLRSGDVAILKDGSIGVVLFPKDTKIKFDFPIDDKGTIAFAEYDTKWTYMNIKDLDYNLRAPSKLDGLSIDKVIPQAIYKKALQNKDDLRVNLMNISSK